LPPIAPGAYAAPPRSGAAVGEQVGGILGGLRIRIPEISIGLPQLEWTGHTRFRRASHMRLDEATAPFVANPHYETALLMREIERRQLQLLEEQRAGRERAARAEDEEDELERLRESERQLREQVTQMQRQIDILIMRLGPPPRRQPCDSAPSPNEPEHLPCPASEVSPTADPNAQHIPAWSTMQPPQTVSYNAAPAHYVPNDMMRSSTATHPFQHGGPADSTPISSAPRSPLMRLPPVDQ
jgi:hypothetical protein